MRRSSRAPTTRPDSTGNDVDARNRAARDHLRALVQALVRWAPGVLLLAFVAQQFSGQWSELVRRGFSFSPIPAVIATAGLALHLGLAGQCWRLLLRGAGITVGYGTAFRIIFLSNLAKYLPGSAWSMLGRAVLAERAGVPRVVAGSTILVEVACQVAAALLVGVISQLVAGWSSVYVPPSTLAAAALAIVLAVHPGLMNLGLAVVQRVVRRPMPRVTLPYRFVLGMVALYTANWTLLGFSFAMLGQALLPQPLTFVEAATLAGAFTIAWNIGVVAFIVPGGLGVREAALVVLLAPSFPPGWPALVGIVARLWLLVAEVTAFTLALAGPAARARGRQRLAVPAGGAANPDQPA